MADPLTALGVASSIVQLIAFSAQLISRGNQIHKSIDGSISENIVLEAVTTDLSTLHLRLEQSLMSGFGPISFRQNNKGLADLVSGSSDLAKELLEKLEAVKVRGRHRKWKSARQALRSVWSQTDIDHIALRLQMYREELEIHILVSLREQTDAFTVRQSEQFNQLDQTSQGVINAILENTVVFRTELQAQGAKHANMINHTNLTIIEEHKKTRRDVIQTILGQRLVQGMVASRSDDFDSNTSPVNHTTEINRRERLVLNILSFPSMLDRPDLVATAHQQTFHWIFRSATVEDLRWDNFQSWLQESNGIYWISGKAGSGKSTLMKYLCNHPRLHQNLAVWAGPIKPTIASFYFWNSGTAMQKSQIGLLRTLLHEVLRQHPELTAIVFPQIFEDLKQGEQGQRESVSMNDQDVRVAFKKLVRQRTIPLRFCVLIDGLDEYDGNHADIADLVREFASSETIKLCISSRPLREFEAAFEHGPSLRLQDLTYQDIVNFVNSKLVHDERMRELKERQPKEALDLVEEIVTKADGVFLWVHLVVKSLLDGLNNYDSISDLQRRLEVLPPDLRDLSKHMI